MRSDLEELIIQENELEAISGVDVNDISLGLAYRPFLLKNSKKLISFLMTQFFILAVIFILLSPLNLSIIRNLGFSGEDIKSTVYFLTLNSGAAIAVWIAENLYFSKKTKNLATFLNFLDEIEKHNEVVKAVNVIDKIEAVGNVGIKVSDREEVIEALNVTRESLINSLRTERILRENKGLIERRYELFANIENNLATLRGLAISDEASEYRRLLNQALKIGLTVDKEVRQLQNRR